MLFLEFFLNNDVNKNHPDKNNDRPISLPAQSRPHGLNVREITERTSLSRPAVSHHLKILKTAGLIDVHREGTCNYYYLSIEDSTRKLMQLGHLLESVLSMDA